MALRLHLPRLAACRLVLASGSPRRRELMESLLSGGGGALEVVPSTFEEDLDKGKYSAAQYALATAKAKGTEVVRRLSGEGAGSKPLVVVSADTVVESPDGAVLEKPRDAEHATAMMQALSGKWHAVHTGVAVTVVVANGGTLVREFSAEFHTTTRVKFMDLTDSVIAAYVATTEPYDKAGGYGIQSAGLGGSMVEAIEGCFFNVMGFPVNAFCKALVDVCDEAGV